MTDTKENLPSGWVLSTQTDHNHTYHNTQTNKTITLIRSRRNNWQVKGLVGYDSKEEKYPLFAEDIPLEKAKEIAFDVMDNSVDGVDVDIEYVSANSDTTESTSDDPQPTDEDSAPSNENQAEDTNKNSSQTEQEDQTNTQQSLTDFVN